jgi:inorganic pyrophosphatase
MRVFRLKKVLPAGMAFPYDFGFVPRTLAEDGDPIDVLVLMDEPAFPWLRWEDVKTLDDLGEQFCHELEQFFANYHQLTGKKYRILGRKGAGTVHKMIAAAVKLPGSG